MIDINPVMGIAARRSLAESFDQLRILRGTEALTQRGYDFS